MTTPIICRHCGQPVEHVANRSNYTGWRHVAHGFIYCAGDNQAEPEPVGIIVKHEPDHRGMVTSYCPRCWLQFIHWDADDLDENGDLLCYCDSLPTVDYRERDPEHTYDHEPGCDDDGWDHRGPCVVES